MELCYADLTPGVGDHPQTSGHTPVAAGAADQGGPVQHTLVQHQVSSRATGVQTGAW